MREIEVYIEGMVGESCEQHIKDVILKKIPDSVDITADYNAGRAHFKLESDKMDNRKVEHELKEGINPLGYRVPVVKIKEV